MGYISEIKEAFTGIFEAIEKTQSKNLEKACEIMKNSIESGGFFYIYDRGHMLNTELIYRSGGAAFVRRFELTVPDGLLSGLNGSTELMRKGHTEEEIRHSKEEFESQYIAYMMLQNGIKKGDVLLINSVSGRNRITNRFTQQCKKMGTKVIAISSLDTVRKNKDEKDSFINQADIVIDNCVMHGDALFRLDGLEEKIVSGSGIAASFIGWCLVRGTLEALLKDGYTPAVYRSVNLDGGVEQNERANRHFAEFGY